MPSWGDLSALSERRLLAKEERTRKLKYEFMVMITCHLFWGVVRIVLDFTVSGVVHPHIFVATIGGLSYYAAELSRADLYLLKLCREIGSRGLDESKFTARDYVEVVASGMSMGLGACGAVEVLDLAFGVHNAGARKHASHLR